MKYIFCVILITASVPINGMVKKSSSLPTTNTRSKFSGVSLSPTSRAFIKKSDDPENPRRVYIIEELEDGLTIVTTIPLDSNAPQRTNFDSRQKS